MIVASLEAQGFNVGFIDYQTTEGNRNDPHQFYRFISERAQSDIIGISVYSSSLPTVLLAVRRLKAEHPERQIILGGPAASDTPGAILQHYPVDIIVQGEGEVTVVELMRALEDRRDLSTVPGLTFRKSGEIISTPPRPRVQDLDSLPYPAYDRVDFRNYSSSLSTVYSRGCPYDCSFCSVHSVWQRKMTYRSPESLADELHHMILNHPGEINEIAFHDDTFILDEDRVVRLMKALRERGIDLPWFCYGRVNLMTEDFLKTLVGYRCSKMLFGIESGSRAVLDRIRKKFTPEEARQVIDLARRHVGWIVTTYIYGFPFETMSDFHDTVHAVLEDRSKGIISNLYLLCPLPQSPLYFEFKDLLVFSPNHHSLLGTPTDFARYPEVVDEILDHPDVFAAFYHYQHQGLEGKLSLMDQFREKNMRLSV
jgi:radical SAM superfamily enzyme YgiQ (UPF0313 family)